MPTTTLQPSEPTTIGSYVLAIAKALESLAINCETVFQDAGVDIHIGANPLDQIPYTQVTRLYQAALKATHDPYFGLYAARFLLPHHLHSLGYSLLASETLLDFLYRLSKHFRLLAKTATFEVTEHHDQVQVSCQLLANICNETQDTFFAFLINFMRHLLNRELAPVKVELIRPQPDEGAEPYRQLFKAPVSFGQPQVTLTFSRDDLMIPLKGASKELAQHNDQITLAYLARLDKGDIVAKVKTLILENLAQVRVTKEFVARQLAMSPRTLQLKLSQSGSNFQKLLDQTRLELSCQHLDQGAMPIAQVAEAVGFQETSSFYRAFKRWTGHSIHSHGRNH